VGTLTTNGETTLVAETAVAIDVDETLDVERDLLAEVTLDLVIPLDDVTDGGDLHVRELLRIDVDGDVRLVEDRSSRGESDAEDVGESDVHALVAREIDAFDSSHDLPLPLLVLWVFAQHADNTAAADDATLVADLFY
jgi:hypothetical protein